MKKLLLILFFVPALALAQDPQPIIIGHDSTAIDTATTETAVIAAADDEVIFPGGQTTLSELLEWYNAIYAALVLIFGFVARGIPAVKKVPNFVYVVVSGGIVLAVGFIALGFGGIIQYVFSFLGAIGIYDIIIKPIQKTVAARRKK